MKTEFPEGKDALSEFVLFRDRVYENRSIRWPANLGGVGSSDARALDALFLHIAEPLASDI